MEYQWKLEDDVDEANNKQQGLNGGGLLNGQQHHQSTAELPLATARVHNEGSIREGFTSKSASNIRHVSIFFRGPVSH
jgi:hypothetical protein